MRFSLFKSLGLSLLLAAPVTSALAQQVPKPAADTLHKYERPATGPGAVEKKSFFQSKGFRASVVPAVLIGYGTAPSTATASTAATTPRATSTTSSAPAATPTWTISCNSPPTWSWAACCWRA
ncbi:hypothetical protein ACFQT0_28100 [Hymenobacter humi]|uniref:Uncharacterized protein n=1 Tax=Hymenobacter humi TaxID=1411620 RepID=A0ABW2UBF6_9BACT